MSKTMCDKCERKFQCNGMDKTRGMACVDFKKKEQKKNV